MESVQMHINIFDGVIILVFALSALIAFFRGFIRELLSLGAWLGAAIVTIYFFPHSVDFMKSHMKNDHMAAGLGALGTFVCAFIGISILNALILKYVKTGAEVGLLDNFLGLVFGALRGAFIVSLAFLVLSAVINKDKPPEWLEQSFTKEYLQQGADVIANVMPEYIKDMEDFAKEKQREVQQKKAAGDEGYKEGNLKDMDRLINSNTNKEWNH